MATNFFARFPQIDYNMDGQGSLLTLTNIVKNVDVNDLYANNSTYYTYHEIMDGERPDIISYRLYGTPNYYWTFFILNNHLRGGLNSAWPLSSQQLERMLVREYDEYSSISFLPEPGLTLPGIGVNGITKLILLWDEYLPHLRITDEDGSEQAKILKYDSSLLQLVIHDVEKTDGSGLVSDIRRFVKDPAYFRLRWVNPFDANTQADEWAANEEVKTEFVNRTIDIYKEFDTFADAAQTLNLEELTSDEVQTVVAVYNSNYVFTKEYVAASDKYRWVSYRDAAAEYYREDGDSSYSMAAFDNILDSNIVDPKFISNFEKEEVINNRKSQIRVIRSDKINEFINSYFEVLNAR